MMTSPAGITGTGRLNHSAEPEAPLHCRPPGHSTGHAKGFQGFGGGLLTCASGVRLSSLCEALRCWSTETVLHPIATGTTSGPKAERQSTSMVTLARSSLRERVPLFPGVLGFGIVVARLIETLCGNS